MDFPLTLEQVQECLESFVRGESVPQMHLSEALRQVQFLLESDDLSLTAKARLQKLELAVLDTYRPQSPLEETRLVLTFVPSQGEGVQVSVLVKCVEAVIDLITEVARATDLTFIPAYDLTALQAGGLNVEIRCLSLQYYQPTLQEQETLPYLNLIERVGELFQTLATGNPVHKEALHHLLSPKARRSLNQLVRFLREEDPSDLKELILTLAQGSQRLPCAHLAEENREYFYFTEAPEWQELEIEGVLIRREQDLDERKNAVHVQDRSGSVFMCRKFQERVYQDQLSHLPLGSLVRLSLKVRYSTEEPLRRAEARVLRVLYPPLVLQQMTLPFLARVPDFPTVQDSG